jgi:hypothetical protein
MGSQFHIERDTMKFKNTPVCFLSLALSVAAMLSTLATSATGQVIADSVADFSLVQGRDGWEYGYYETPGQAASFRRMAHTFPAGTYWIPAESAVWSEDADPFRAPWDMVYARGACPAGTNYGGPLRWSVRRWTAGSEVYGTVRLTGTLSKMNPNGHGVCGDGVRGFILVNGSSVWEHSISATDMNGVVIDVLVYVMPGDYVDFAVSPLANDRCDWTRFEAVVSVVRPCSGDFNGDGFVDFFDYIGFVTAFEGGPGNADFNGDGFVDFFDYSDFVTAFEVGC